MITLHFYRVKEILVKAENPHKLTEFPALKNKQPFDKSLINQRCRKAFFETAIINTNTPL